MRNFAIAAAVSISALMGSIANAESMTCLVSVYTAKSLTNPQAGLENDAVAVKIPLVDGAGDIETTINGEKVFAALYRKEHVDMYHISFALTTPVADRPARGHINAMVSDYAYNDGPTQEGGWDVAHSKTATRFMYVRSQTGSFSVTYKLLQAMKAAGVWGTRFTSASYGLNDSNVQDMINFVSEQLTAGKLQPTDVVGLSTLLTCTHDI